MKSSLKLRMCSQLKGLLSICLLCVVAALTSSCGRSEPEQADLAKQPDQPVTADGEAVGSSIRSLRSRSSRQPDLAKQPDRWVKSIMLDAESKANYVGKTKNYLITTFSSVRGLDGLRTVSIGDEIEGIRIGAIKCTFFWKDESYGGKQFMWRGRWGCQAGRSRHEIENSVGDDGVKHFDYVYVSPVQLRDE